MQHILLIDIETFPQLGWTWASYDANVLAIKEPWKICCVSAKWYDGDSYTFSLPDYGGSEKRLLGDVYKLLDKADVVVAHNGNKFDIPKLNTRLLAHNIPPPSPYKTVDTYKIAKRVFGFTSNKLDSLCQQLGLGKKMTTTGFDLWLNCMNGDKAAWSLMKTYNAHDVVLLEALYKRLLPWMDVHPNISNDLSGCPRCGSTKLQSRGTARTNTRVYKRFQCTSCGGWGRATKCDSSAQVTLL